MFVIEMNQNIYKIPLAYKGFLFVVAFMELKYFSRALFIRNKLEFFV